MHFHSTRGQEVSTGGYRLAHCLITEAVLSLVVLVEGVERCVLHLRLRSSAFEGRSGPLRTQRQMSNVERRNVERRRSRGRAVDLIGKQTTQTAL